MIGSEYYFQFSTTIVFRGKKAFQQLEASPWNRSQNSFKAASSFLCSLLRERFFVQALDNYSKTIKYNLSTAFLLFFLLTQVSQEELKKKQNTARTASEETHFWTFAINYSERMDGGCWLCSSRSAWDDGKLMTLLKEWFL